MAGPSREAENTATFSAEPVASAGRQKNNIREMIPVDP